ncbi:MAG: deacetylase [Ruminococcaceae bacterium]|nr:deacetylase [Oscillospiraceae bacterium]
MSLRFLVLRRKHLMLLAAALASAAIFAAVNAPAAVMASGTARQLPIYCVERDQKVCAISFDAAWGADNTEKILDVLDEYGVKATFFVVSAWAEQYPDTAKLIVARGHELMNHSSKHDHYNSLTADQIVADVNHCNDVLESLSGVRPTLMRCPFGEYDDHVISAIRSAGMEPIQWDVDSLDWKGISAAEITRRVTGKVGCGSIVLFHNAGEHTPEALPGVLRCLRQQGYEIVPISELLLDGEYTINHEGRQCAVR